MHKLQTNAQVIKIHLYNAEIREIWQFVKFWAFLWTKYKTNLTRRVYRVGLQESPSFVTNAVQLLPISTSTAGGVWTWQSPRPRRYILGIYPPKKSKLCSKRCSTSLPFQRALLVGFGLGIHRAGIISGGEGALSCLAQILILEFIWIGNGFKLNW